MYSCHRKAHEPLSIATVTLTIEGAQAGMQFGSDTVHWFVTKNL